MCKINTINIHFLDACNFKCGHCFVNKENSQLSFEQIKVIVDKISAFYHFQGIADGRINLAGGEPMMSNDIDGIIAYIYSKGLKVSLITNGYYLTPDFINRHKNQLYCIGISVDSLNLETNRRIGRCQKDGEYLSTSKLLYICKCIKTAGIRLKINTCVSKLNYQEDFTGFLKEVSPDRYKALQMVCEDFDVRNVINRITSEEMDDFVRRHQDFITVKETSEEMKSSYLIVDSKGNMSCDNSHKTGYSVFENDIEDILMLLDINEHYFERRYDDNYQSSVIHQ